MDTRNYAYFLQVFRQSKTIFNVIHIITTKFYVQQHVVVC